MNKRQRYKVSVSVFVFISDGENVLMLERGNTGWMDGHISVPAGAIDGGEDLAMAATREVSEEVGLSLEAADLKLVHTMHCFTGEDEWLGQYFMVDRWSGQPQLMEPDKHNRLFWSPVESMPEMTIPYVRQAIELSLAGQAYSRYRAS